uniref:Retrotransposon protein, putative, Ty1-copia subclass n=1 Tax=Oryza sativa subsp. japonica TaxID=39947 RepID=Q2QS76_ORYSJ|nr:retrotransposon protein, putative, Ty1-copia subclass [Oryza sativa Japonica Group]
MQCFYISRKKRSELPLSPEEEARFEDSDCLFRGTLISILADNIVDVYMHMPSGKVMWNAFEAKFGVSDTSSELYVMEQFYDYEMVDYREGESKGQQGKNIEGGSSANLVQKKNPHASHNNNNKKVKPDVKPKATTNFKDKGKGKAKGDCFVCGKPRHWAKNCPNRKDKKSANMVISEGGGTSGYGKFLPTILSVFHSPDWWVDTGANIHVCADISMFSSYQVGRDSSLLMGNGSLAVVHGVGMVDLKFTSGKTVQLKNVQHVPLIKKNLVSSSLLCRDAFRLVFESNKCAVSKYGTFIGKGYVSGVLFRFSLDDMRNNNNDVNHISENDEFNVWHSRLCHMNFGCMTRLANMSLIAKFTLVKGSKCHTCVQSKQPRKPHNASEARNLAPLELVHFDLCEMNGVLSKEGKKYFMTLIDDCTRFCYVYLLKTKDEALYYFKIYKAEEWWGEAILTTFHVLNKIPVKHKKVAPFKEWERKKLNLSYLRTWGCLAKNTVIKRLRKILRRITLYTRKSKRQRVAKSFGDDYIVYLVDDTPRTIEEAYSSPDADYWKEAVRSEMDSIISNSTWEVVERPYGCKPVGCKLVFKKKLRPDGTIKKYKVRLVAKGYKKRSLNVIEEVKDFLSQSFEMKDLGVANVVLNIKLLRGDEGGITLVQSHYVDNVLSRFGYSDCKPSPTPYDSSVLLRKNRRIARDQLRYSHIIGSLIYLASATSPDISFAVSKLSRFVSNPGDDHWQALERVIRYLKGTVSYGIHYTVYPKVLEGYSDSNLISDADEIKATSGYVFTLGGGAVSDHLNEVNNGSRTHSTRYCHS